MTNYVLTQEEAGALLALDVEAGDYGDLVLAITRRTVWWHGEGHLHKIIEILAGNLPALMAVAEEVLALREVQEKMRDVYRP